MFGPGSEDEDDSFHEDSTVEELQQQIFYHQRTARNLLSRLNSLTPINRLLVELLIKIVEHFIALHVFSMSPYPPKIPAKPYIWLKPTHVCRHWRRVALECPTLWTHIATTGYEDCIQTVLHRSKSLPLTFQVDAMSSGHQEGWLHLATRPVLCQLHRILVLELRSSRVFLNHGSLFGKPAPHLECIILHNTDRESLLSLPSLYPELPNFQRLEALHYSLHSLKPFFRSTLRYLLIDSGNRGQYIPVTDVLDVMDGMPLLEVLRLGRLRFAGGDAGLGLAESSSAIRTIALNHLLSLHLHASGATSTLWLLEHLHLPVLSSLSLECDSTAGDPTRGIVDLPVSKLLGASGQTRHYLQSFAVITNPKNTSIRLKGWTSVETVQDMLHGRTCPQVEIAIPDHYQEVDGTRHSVYQILSHSSLFSGVKALILGSVGQPQSQAIPPVVELLSLMPHIRALGIWNWEEKHVASLLLSPCVYHVTNSSGMQVSRRLRPAPLVNTLLLRRLRFSMNHRASSKSTISYVLQKLRQKLPELRTLVMEKCFNLQRSSGDHLLKEAAKVYWRWDDSRVYGDDHEGLWDYRWMNSYSSHDSDLDEASTKWEDY